MNVIDSRSCCVQFAIRSRCPASTTEIKPPQPRRKVPPAIVDMNRRRQSPKIIIKFNKNDSHYHELTCSLWHTNSSQGFYNCKFHWPSSEAIPVAISSDNILVINLEEHWCNTNVVLTLTIRDIQIQFKSRGAVDVKKLVRRDSIRF